jgi:hypothetical protein
MKFIITLSLLLLACCAYAQPLPPTPDPVPLDGGIIGLLVAGAVYGVNKINLKTTKH